MDEVKNIGEKCNCPHHKMVPLMVLLIGLTFLLGALNILSGQAVSIIWPILVIIAAGTKISSSKCKCCNKSN